ncbi:LRR receptor-like serine/threonine-protein kinase ERL2 isoform X2 [Solanum tuberosum]|uniref:LRR receptor-like serine/threonine-protein kinase ERL2 isoform X2 n=1 Tax=Solanum tuberosum TaxID=4113 RepID=UPI00073A31FF|nr:PREDICTED: LRR receptor-like serine/threonine-protein kinase ERL2 isoform X2 [Solanum tuberosum]
MKVLAITLWVLLFFILKNTKFVICVGICRENEQRALETLKKEIHDPSDIPSSWIVGKDCCEWEGVVCNNLSRHVIELHLGYVTRHEEIGRGMIPVSTQLQSFDSTSFQGNKLCGLPLLVNCSSDGNIPNNKHEDDESDKDEVDWFYISMAIGFALSFWGVCGSLFLRGHGDMLIFVCMLTFLMLAIMLFHCIFK